MARFPSIDETGSFEAPEVQNQIKHLVTGGAGDIRVDTSAGPRVFVGDTMIHGNTGVRRVDTGLGEAYPALQTIFMVRENNNVFIWFNANGTPPNTGRLELLQLPLGWRPAGLGVVGSVANAYGGGILNNFTNFGVNVNALYLDIDSTVRRIRGSISYYSKDPWPTSLPGTPA